MLAELLPPDHGLSLDDLEILRGLLDPTAEVTVIMPADVDGDTLWRGLTVACKAIAHVQRIADRLRPVIGRMLLTAREKEGFITSRGFRSWDDFVRNGISKTFGMKRSTAYEVMNHARLHPSLSPERYAKIGPTNMSIVSKFTREGDSKYQEHMRAAEVLPTPKLREYAEERKLITVAETIPAAIVIQATLDIRKHWEAFAEDGRVQSVCGSSSPGKILEHMLEECSSWLTE